jgi:triosephosphate isomerase
VRLAQSIDRIVPANVELVIAPPFVYLSAVGSILRNAVLGAQNLFGEEAKSGPYTGEISALQLRRLGVKYVIVGHSERRALGESDEIINKKIKTALGEGLGVILCVGEPKRESGIKSSKLKKEKSYVKRQLLKDLIGICGSRLKIRHPFVVAYEPVWAIGTGRADKPEEAAEMIKFIKNVLKTKIPGLNARVLYGGSVNAKNASGFLNQREIEGALVGGASLKIKEFRKIIGIMD